MKTNILYIAALVIAGALVSWQKEPAKADAASAVSMKAIPEGTPTVTHNMIVHYQVSVFQSISAPICGTYLVEIVNSNGQLVDAPKVFKPSQTLYFFSEQVMAPSGVRIARLVQTMAADGSLCPNALSTKVDKESMTFKDGRAYFFYLYPSYMQGQTPD